MKTKLKKSAPEPKQYVVLNDMVLVQRHSAIDDGMTEIEKAQKEVAGTLSNKASIIAIADTNPLGLKKDDVVLFSEHAANDIELDGQDFLLLNFRQIYMKL